MHFMIDTETLSTAGDAAVIQIGIQAAAPAAAVPKVAEPAQEGTANPLASLWDSCSRHDWTHMMSDDPGVNRRGGAEASRLRQEVAACGPEGKALYDAWHDHIWKQGERPGRPE